MEQGEARRPDNNHILIKPGWDLRQDNSERKRGLGKIEKSIPRESKIHILYV